MNAEFPVENITCDGSHFTAVWPNHDTIEGPGTFRQNDDGVSGLIRGTVTTGPERFRKRPVLIRVDGDTGRCCIL
jgi:hypothetical protein